MFSFKEIRKKGENEIKEETKENMIDEGKNNQKENLIEKEIFVNKTIDEKI